MSPNPTNQFEDFLTAVDDLRSEDASVRTTAHTSSVSAEGWPTTDHSAPEPTPGTAA
ncbi:hypothetical protein NE857_22180 [Nocardiopsis exhalans]|uniref:Uncharacterized protein n=2 Tax=Nocardiopsis TaxID=2013 RepID=A0A840W3M5_9ACTN|nr:MULTISPECIES: hypothetical protein [Nocardiopsis]MBB5491479.1 hypothetical protein [Nocardiopsis metallicus]USY18026.1 hypothetical protein NE857_22180 [Nocardiopsis exhalans]